MPLLDHFRSSWSADWPWESFHANWATKIADHLNDGLLPPDYYALGVVKRGGTLEIDVATLKDSDTSSPGGGTAVWAPPPASAVTPVDFEGPELIEVQVFRRAGGSELRAAIELVSPRNKDRPESRKVFATKCASYLHVGVSLVLVDIVTDRHANIHAELVHFLGLNGEAPWRSPTDLYAVAYRRLVERGRSLLEVWREPLTLGASLPTMPLWIDVYLSVPLRLEESYMAARASSRLPE